MQSLLTRLQNLLTSLQTLVKSKWQQLYLKLYLLKKVYKIKFYGILYGIFKIRNTKYYLFQYITDTLYRPPPPPLQKFNKAP